MATDFVSAHKLSNGRPSLSVRRNIFFKTRCERKISSICPTSLLKGWPWVTLKINFLRSNVNHQPNYFHSFQKTKMITTIKMVTSRMNKYKKFVRIHCHHLVSIAGKTRQRTVIHQYVRGLIHFLSKNAHPSSRKMSGLSS